MIEASLNRAFTFKGFHRINTIPTKWEQPDLDIKISPPKISIYVSNREGYTKIFDPILQERQEAFNEMVVAYHVGYEYLPLSPGLQGISRARPDRDEELLLTFGSSNEGFMERTELYRILRSQEIPCTTVELAEHTHLMWLMLCKKATVTRGGLTTFESIAMNSPTIIYRRIKEDFTENHLRLHRGNLAYLATLKEVEEGLLRHTFLPLVKI